jgi:hypothetical protein
VAPSPEAFVVDRGVEQATLTTAVPSASAAVPLTPSPTTGPRPVAARPLPDWRILAALGGAQLCTGGPPAGAGVTDHRQQKVGWP